jgi:hypothetical protein
VAQRARQEREGKRLHCLGGDAAPADITNDAARLTRLNDGAIAALWPVLEPCVVRPVSAELGQHLSAFCLQHEIAEADLGHVIRICRWLLHSAASVDLSSERLGQDIDTLWPEPGALRGVLLDNYPAVKSLLRDVLLANALVKHGNVLDNVEWRIDRVAADTKAPRLDLPVALVTLSYRNRDRSEHLTLQLTPEQLMRTTRVLSALAEQTLKLMPKADSSAPNGSSAPGGGD